MPLSSQVAPGGPATPTLANPAIPDVLGLLRTQHLDQKSVCELLEGLAANLYQPGAAELATAIYDYLTGEYRAHAFLEREHLCVLLKRRGLPGDGLERMVRRLDQGQDEAARLVAELLDDLGRLASGSGPRDPQSFVLTSIAFGMVQRRLADWEDADLLALARCRLGPGDLDELSQSIARLGIVRTRSLADRTRDSHSP